jgi:hypothetical protein
MIEPQNDIRTAGDTLVSGTAFGTIWFPGSSIVATAWLDVP